MSEHVGRPTVGMTERERAARAIGYLEGFSSWVWAEVGEKLADECAALYDKQVEALGKVLFEEKGNDDDED